MRLAKTSFDFGFDVAGVCFWAGASARWVGGRRNFAGRRGGKGALRAWALGGFAACASVSRGAGAGGSVGVGLAGSTVSAGLAATAAGADAINVGDGGRRGGNGGTSAAFDAFAATAEAASGGWLKAVVFGF